MKATLLLRRRIVLAIDAFAEMVVWRVPESVPPSGHRCKYRLAYAVAGQCVVRYDNERGRAITGTLARRKSRTYSPRRINSWRISMPTF